MACCPLTKLPPELLRTIFVQLPISSLLAFAQTSRSNYTLATSVLTELQLAIFPKRIHSVLAFLEEECREDIDDDDLSIPQFSTGQSPLVRPRRSSSAWSRPRRDHDFYQISFATQSSISPPTSPSNLISGRDRKMAKRASSIPRASPLSIRTAEFVNQNDLATTILSSRSIRYNVKSLTLHLYTLHSSALATILSLMSTLQHLNLNFSHAYINDTTLPASYWRTTPSQGSGSPVWNTLAGIGSEASSTLQLRNLRTLTLRRAGITSYQLRSWIASNPYLQRIVLEKVRGVDLEFVNWLADHVAAQNERIDLDEALETIVFTDCSELTCETVEDFTWISKLAMAGIDSRPLITTLSVRGCKNVDDRMFCQLAGIAGEAGVESSGNAKSSPSSTMASEMDVDPSELSPHPSTQIENWSQWIYRLVSPNGMLIKEGQQVSKQREKQKMGMRSPALTISEALSGSFVGTTSSGGQYRKWSRQEEEMIEVDPDLL